MAIPEGNMETKMKHLEFIQGVINRMAGNSFMIKGWSLTIISAGFALLAIRGISLYYLFIAAIPIICFWILDGYFLSQERMFRTFYKNKAENGPDSNFGMDPKEYDNYLGGKKRNSRWNCFWSMNLLVFYVPQIILVAVVAFGVTYLERDAKEVKLCNSECGESQSNSSFPDSSRIDSLSF